MNFEHASMTIRRDAKDDWNLNRNEFQEDENAWKNYHKPDECMQFPEQLSNSRDNQ